MKDEMKMLELNQAQTRIWIWWLWDVCSWHLTQHRLRPGKTERVLVIVWLHISSNRFLSLVDLSVVCQCHFGGLMEDEKCQWYMVHERFGEFRQGRSSCSSADTNSVIEWQVNQISLNTTTANPVAGGVSVWPIRGSQHYRVSHFTWHLMS